MSQIYCDSSVIVERGSELQLELLMKLFFPAVRSWVQGPFTASHRKTEEEVGQEGEALISY